MSFDTPQAYARHLATYIASPTKIEAYTRLEFGEAPPLHTIANMRLQVEMTGKHYRNARRELWQVERENQPKPRTYDNSGTVYMPAHVTIQHDHLNSISGVRSHRDVVVAVAKAFGFTYAEITGPRRSTSLVCARAVAAKILQERGNSLPCIARYLGRTDHSTIHNLLSKYPARIAAHPQMAVVYERLTAPDEAMAA